jgi:dTDP-4-dehydrorhamnose reductase
MTLRVAITGAGGMLGSALGARLAGKEVLPIGRGALDVTHAAALRVMLREFRPEVVVNCAADTDVEGAESDPARCFAANALLPELLAQFCRDSGARLVHFSSAGCYGDYKTTPYVDYDPLRPSTTHHRAKAAGEAAVREAGGRHLILRLGWLYGGGAGHLKNFVWNRIVEARGSPEIGADPYQTGSPTFVGDVVAQTMTLLEAELSGTYNCVAGGAVPRLDYVSRIVAAAGLSTRIVPRRFVRRATVSPNEAAINEKLDLLGLNVMPEWGKALDQYIKRLLSPEGTSDLV